MSGTPDDVQSIANCRVCQRSGLPILPLRYAVTRTDGSDQGGHPPGPAIPGTLEDENLAAIPLPEGQRYTLRLLRGGFLYVFNETRGRWIGHVVTEKGYLIEYVDISHEEVMAIDPDSRQPIDARLQPPAEEQEFACAANPVHAYPGRCVMIPDADRADNVYLSFSDVAWTKRVWKEHATNTNQRRDSMRRVSLAAWRGGSAQCVESLEKLGDVLSESSRIWSPVNPTGASGNWRPGASGSWGEDDHQGKAFDFSPFPFHGMQEQVEGLQRWGKEQAGPLEMTSMLVALEDPVGIAADLAGLMAMRLQEFMNSDGRRWPLATAALIDSLEPAIREQAQFRYIDKRVDSGPLHRPIFTGPGQPSWEEQQRINAYHDRLERSREAGTDFYKQERDKARKEVSKVITPEELRREADQAWAKYQSRLQNGQPEFWKQTQFKPEQERFDQNVMLPLIHAHQSWLTGTSIHKQFDAHFDDEDAESGQAFADTVVLCLQDTQQYGPAFEKYVQWLIAPTIAEDNWLLRGMLLNLRSIWEAVNAQAAPELSINQVATLSWAGLVASYQSATEQFPDTQAAPGRLLGAVLAPMLSALDEQTVRPGLIALGVISGRKVTHTRISGHVSDAIDGLIVEMQRINPALQGADQTLLKEKLRIQTRGNYRRMQPVGKGNFDISIVFDTLSIEEVDTSADGRTVANRVGDTVMDYNQWRRTHGSVWGSIGDRETQLGIVSLVLGIWAISAQAKAMDEATADERTETQWRFRALVSGAIGSVADIGHAIMERIHRMTSRLSRGLGRILRRTVGGLGKVLGFAAAAVMAFWDGYNFLDKVKKGQVGLAGLYLLSAISGLGAFFCLTIFSVTGVGLLLAATAIVFNIFIALWSNNALQDWVEKCYFGVEDAGDKYANLKTETDAFDALAGQ